MPWKVQTLELQRQSLCHRIVHLGLSVSAAACEAKVSRKTIYKHLARYKADPGVTLADRSRRPHRSHGRVSDAFETRVLELRDRYGWGARKLHAILRGQACNELCSIRTLTNVLRRHARIGRVDPPVVDQTLVTRFEHTHPNDLWQVDHKGPIEIARRKHHLFTIVDDHSRYCLSLEPMREKSLVFTWPVLWECLDVYGLPKAILGDGAFADRGVGVSLFDQRLIRLGIRPIHGRPYHPQTQGKVERLHGTISRELLNARVRTDTMQGFVADRDLWQSTYNLVRPHEALEDHPPIARYQQSRRPRPSSIPEMSYEASALLRKVSQVGDVRYHRARITVGRGLKGEWVKLIEQTHDLEIYYGPRLVRVIQLDQLTGRRLNEIV